jgi:hypothetical protein
MSMKFKPNPAGMQQLETELKGKLSQITKEVLANVKSRAAGADDGMIARMVRKEFSARGINLSEDGVRQMVDALRGDDTEQPE